MSAESRNNEPNEFGFSGGATAPEPDRERESPAEAEGENIAVPSGDLTGALSDGLDDMTHPDESSH
jgi:hypothetical protein